MTAKHWIAVAALTAGIFYVAIPKPHNGTNSAARAEAISNGRQLHINLVAFSKKYGTFPSAETLRTMLGKEKH